jgi:metal-responsive CopG/Arc/MetJ family transcriptional regulator
MYTVYVYIGGTIMFRTQVYLTSSEREGLDQIAQELGKHKSELIREAIDQFIINSRSLKREKRSALKAAAGLWKNREDLPDLRSLRKEFDRLDYND